MNEPNIEMTTRFKRELVLAELKQWNSADQCLLLIDSLKMVSLSLVKFINTISNDLIKQNNAVNSLDSDANFSNIMEEQANDIAYFRVLNDKPIDTKLKFLILYLPLIRIIPNNRKINEELKEVYNELIQNIVEECFMENKYLQECQEILTYASLHPIFGNIEKSSYQKWLEILEEGKRSTSRRVSFLDEVLGESEITQNSKNIQQKYENVLKPQESSASIGSSYISDNESVSSKNEISLPTYAEKSCISIRKHLLLERASSSPMEPTENKFNKDELRKSNYTNSFETLEKNDNQTTKNVNKNNMFVSNPNLKDNNNYNNNATIIRNTNAGMRNLTHWLKNIKLHKYTDFFITMTYNDLITLSDEKLISANITLGARKKILNCVDKLKERPKRLKQLCQIMDDRRSPPNTSVIENILIELTEISLSPIEPNKTDPTCVNSLENFSPNDLKQKLSQANENLCQLILDLFDRIQSYLIPFGNNENQLNELIKICLKIIDKLFLTKAFSDIQNLHMAKLRAKFNEKLQALTAAIEQGNIGLNPPQITFSGSSYENNNNDFGQNSHTLLQKSNSLFVNHFNDTRQKQNSDGSAGLLNPNSVNAQKRIQNKNLKTVLSKTKSAPFCFNQNQHNDQEHSKKDSIYHNKSDDTEYKVFSDTTDSFFG